MSIINVQDTYRVTRDSNGVVNSIHRIRDGASLIYYPTLKQFDEFDSLTIELREWEAKHEELDLSDHEPDPTPPDDDGGGDDGGGDIIF